MANVQPAAAQPEILYRLRSILDPIDLGCLFPTPQPLEVELGSGDGSFLAEYAKLRPERNFIGVERLLGRIRKLEKKGRRAGLLNLRGVRIESAYFLQYLLPPHSAAAIHIYFPDPWPKRRHHQHRLIKEGFPTLAAQALASQGTVYLRTDDRDYFEQMLAVFGPDQRFRAIDTPPSLAAIVTDFEREFTTRGISTQRAAFQLR